MKTSRLSRYLFSAVILTLALVGCSRRASEPPPEVYIPLDPPVIEVEPLIELEPVETLAPPALAQDQPAPTPLVLVVEPTPAPPVFLVEQPTPTPLIVVVQPPTPTPLVVVVTATPQRVVVLPETGADLTTPARLDNRIWPVSLILLGLSLTVIGLLTQRR